MVCHLLITAKAPGRSDAVHRVRHGRCGRSLHVCVSLLLTDHAGACDDGCPAATVSVGELARRREGGAALCGDFAGTSVRCDGSRVCGRCMLYLSQSSHPADNRKALVSIYVAILRKAIEVRVKGSVAGDCLLLQSRVGRAADC